MTNRSDKEAYASVFGKNYKTKDAATAANTQTTRTPGLVLREGQEVTFIKKMDIVEVPYQIGTRSGTFDAIAVYVDGKPTRFPLSVLQNAFTGIFANSIEECGKKIVERSTGTQFSDDISHRGAAVDIWRNANTQAAAVEAIGGMKFKVHICGYVASMYDASPKPCYEFQESK